MLVYGSPLLERFSIIMFDSLARFLAAVLSFRGVEATDPISEASLSLSSGRGILFELFFGVDSGELDESTRPT